MTAEYDCPESFRLCRILAVPSLLPLQICIQPRFSVQLAHIQRDGQRCRSKLGHGLLVAKVQVSALGALVGCGLAYTALGIGLRISAYRVSSTEVRDIAEQLSLPGLTAAAIGEKKAYESEHGGARSGAVFNEKLTRKETSRVAVDGSPQNGYD